MAYIDTIDYSFIDACSDSYSEMGEFAENMTLEEIAAWMAQPIGLSL